MTTATTAVPTAATTEGPSGLAWLLEALGADPKPRPTTYAAGDPLLRLRDMRVNYGESLILRGLDMDIREGEITVVMGRNGVGKTTLMRSIMGLLKPAGGSIAFREHDITRVMPYRRARLGISLVPQGREIFPKLTVYENLLMGLEARTDGVTQLPKDELYELFPVLGTMENRLGGNLSGGQQQQLAIARALAGNPKLLLLDEPTEGLQPSIIHDIERVLVKLKKRGGLTIVLVEQYLDFAKQVADHFYIMDRGSIVMSGGHDALTDEHVKKYLTF